jgi:uncharacterized Rmd1/YagE family protein
MSYLVREGIDLTRVKVPPIARAPLTIELDGGIAVLYRYGGVVFFGVGEEARKAFLAGIGGSEAVPDERGEEAELRRGAAGEVEGIDAAGGIVFERFDLPRLRLAAEVLARSAVLSFYEAHLANVLRDIEPPIARLRLEGRLPGSTRALLRSVGEVLQTEIRMIGRAEISEKPEFVWEMPEFDRLYMKLSEEFELIDRDRALSRKLDLVMRSVSVLIDALSARRSLHVEWAIFALILVEIVMAL